MGKPMPSHHLLHIPSTYPLQGFYINLVIGAVFAPFYLLLLPSIDPQRGKTFAEKCAMIDWPTTVSFFAGSCCLTLGISLGGLVYNYNSAAEIALWVVTCACLIATVLLLRFHPTVAKTDRLYPVHFFKRPILINMQAQVFLSSAIILVSCLKPMTYLVNCIVLMCAAGNDLLYSSILPVRPGTFSERVYLVTYTESSCRVTDH